ncbi:hypothetical protein R7E32_22695 [Vibrio sp. Vb2130]|nr:hypothetical protein [Vibrio sp. Vb2130]
MKSMSKVKAIKVNHNFAFNRRCGALISNKIYRVLYEHHRYVVVKNEIGKLNAILKYDERITLLQNHMTKNVDSKTFYALLIREGAIWTHVYGAYTESIVTKVVNNNFRQTPSLVVSTNQGQVGIDNIIKELNKN